MMLETENLNKSQKQPSLIADVINCFSGENLIKLQKHFVNLYGSDEMAQEKANSFAVGFGKACEMICNDLQQVHISDSLPSEIYVTYDRNDGEVLCAFVDEKLCEQEADECGCGMQTVRLIGK